MGRPEESPVYGKLEKAAIDFVARHRESAAGGDFGAMEHLAQAASVIQAVSLARVAGALERIASTMEDANRIAEPGDHALVGASGEGFTADDSIGMRSVIGERGTVHPLDRDKIPSVTDIPPSTGSE